MGAQNFDFAPKFSLNGFLVHNSAFLDEDFSYRPKFNWVNPPPVRTPLFMTSHVTSRLAKNI